MKIAVLPRSNSELDLAIEGAGAEQADLSEAEALVWTEAAQDGFPEVLPENIQWVQLKSAGIRPWILSGQVDELRMWTSAVGAYSHDVAEHAVSLLLASLRLFPRYAATHKWTKQETWSQVRSLRGRRIAIVGCGSIGRAIVPMLRSFGAEVIAVNRSGRSVQDAVRTVTAEHLNSVLADADDMIIAGASTEQTKGLIGAEQFASLGPDGFVVNIARGDLLDQDALVRALRDKSIAGAALDVTEPEPLPEDSPLWQFPNVLITPHIANPLRSMVPNFASFVASNITAYKNGESIHGAIDLQRSY